MLTATPDTVKNTASIGQPSEQVGCGCALEDKKMRRALLLTLVLSGCSGGGGESPTGPPPMTGPANLTGRVTTSGTTTPVTGAVVRAGVQSSTTGTDGRYTLSNLTAGQVTLTVERSGYEPYSRTVTISSGANIFDVQLSQSTAGTSVTGTVSGFYPIDGTTPRLSGATVTIAGKTDTTDASGNFQLPTVPEGNQEVTVTLPGWNDFRQSFFISSTNRTLTINLTYALPDLRNSFTGITWRGCACAASGQGNDLKPTYGHTVPATSHTITLRGEYHTQLLPALRGCGSLTCDDPRTGIGTVPFTTTHNPQGALPPLRVIRRWCGGASQPDEPVRATIMSITVAAPNDVNQWTHYSFDPRLTNTTPLNGIPNINAECP